MKHPVLFLLFITAAIFSCNSGTLKQTTASVKTTVAITSGSSDSSVIDSVIHDVNIEGKMYDVSILTDKYDSNHQLLRADDPTIASLTVVLSSKETYRVAIKRKFRQNEFKLMKRGNIKLSENGKLYISLINIGGGSGFEATLYCVGSNADGKLDFIPIMDYTELTRFAINKNDSEAFILSGDWNFHETHFEEHRLKVSKYKLHGGKYVEMKLGETTHKYSSEEEMKDVVKEIEEKEPQALKGIKLANYSFDDK